LHRVQAENQQLCDRIQQLETQLKEQSPAMESVRDLEVEVRKLRLNLNFIEVRDSFLVHYAPPRRQESKEAIKGYLTDFLYQLENKKYPLPGDALQRLDQVVDRWRVAKRGESLDRTTTAFNNFIEALLELGPNNEQKD